MHKLFELLRRNIHVLLFVLLEIMAVTLMYNRTDYHGSVLFGTSNRVVGHILSYKGEFDKYRGLHEANLELMRSNAQLEKEVLKLNAAIERYKVDSLYYNNVFVTEENPASDFEYSVAEIVGQTNLTKTIFLTINKGSHDGVTLDMGVLSTRGVVGSVVAVGTHFSKVLPLVNNSFSLSCKLSNQEYLGSLQWDGESLTHSVLTRLPKHLSYTPGDTVLTSGYSTVFPKGLFVGIVEGETKSTDDNFLSLRVKLATDFEKLRYVYMVKNMHKSERDSLDRVSIR
ncbi:MAG: rod shape-determining protein MreC [Porphyromonas sp.]|nr:rod shape-determining protein MreC [Porphyromonas sp.]